MLGTALRSLRHRWAASVAAFLTMVAAAAVVTACGGLMESGLRAGMPTVRYAAADLVVGGRASIPGGDPDEVLPERVGVPLTLADRLAGVRGVAEVVPDRIVPVHVPADPDNAVRGHGWASAAFASLPLRSGAPPEPGQVVIDAGLADRTGLDLGSSITLGTREGAVDYRVAAITAGAAPPGRPGAVYFAETEVARLAPDPDQAAALLLRLAAGSPAADVRARLAGALHDSTAVVLADDERGRPEFPEAAASGGLVVAIAGTFGGLALAIAIFVVAGTTALSVQQRRRELGLLRALGATPGQLRTLIVVEALLVSVLAGAAGCLPGFALTGALQRAFVDRGLVPDSFAVTLGPVPLIVAGGSTVLVGLLAALATVWRPSRLSPVVALTEAAVEPRQVGWVRVTLGVVALAGAGVLFAVATAAGGDVALGSALGLVLLVTVGVALLGPVVTALPSQLLALPLRLAPVTGYLAATSVRTSTRRLAGAVAPLVLAVGFTATGLSLPSLSAYAAAEETRAGVRANAVLTAPVLPEGLADQVREVPGVVGVAALVDTTVVGFPLSAGEVDVELYSAVGLRESGPQPTVDLDVVSGDLGRLGGDTVAMSLERARALDVTVGDRVRLLLGDGTPVEPEVVALYTRGRGFAGIVLPADLVLDHTTTGVLDQVLVRVDPSTAASTTDQLAELAAALPGAAVLDPAALAAAHLSVDVDAWVSYLVIAILAALVAIAVVNSLVIATSERERELALLRLLGLGRVRVLGMVAAEGLVLAAVAILLGIATAIGTLVPVSLTLSGDPVPHLSLPMFAAVGGSAVGITLLAVVTTAALVVRRPPVHVTGGRV
jgi:putative ABC transport system permease protein